MIYTMQLFLLCYAFKAAYKSSAMYDKLFVSAWKLVIKGNQFVSPQVGTYFLISTLELANIGTFILLMKYFVNFKLYVNKLQFVILLIVPVFLVNYFVFLHKRRYHKILAVNKDMGLWLIVSYFAFTLLFWIVVGYLNVLKYGK